MREHLDHLFNWKRNPSSVFYFAGPLALIGFSLVFLRAYLELTTNGDPWYLAVAVGGVVLLLVGLYPVARPLLRREHH